MLLTITSKYIILYKRAEVRQKNKKILQKEKQKMTEIKVITIGRHYCAAVRLSVSLWLKSLVSHAMTER